MSRIASVAVGRFDYPMAAAFKFITPGPDGIARRPTVLIRLTDEDGVQGWGQAVPVPLWSDETPETAASTIVHYLAPELIGADPADLGAIHDRLNAAIRPAFGVGQPLAKAGIDIACHDLLGKQRGVPVHALFGTTELSCIRLSWTVSAPALVAAEEQIEAGRARGFRNVNIKIGPPQTPAYDLELARLARRVFSDGFLWADANTSYAADDALAMAPRLAEAGVDVLESPLPPVAIRGYQALKRQGALPILMDEGIVGPDVLAEFITLGMLDGAVLKPARNAGLHPTVAMVRLLRERNLLMLGSGLTDPDLALAASLHVNAWAGIAHPCALNGPQFLADRLSGDALVPNDDQISVPTGPGLGISLDERATAALDTIIDARGVQSAA